MKSALDDQDEIEDVNWWIPEEIVGLEVELSDGTKETFCNQETEVYKFGDVYEHMNFISYIDPEDDSCDLVALFDEPQAMDLLEDAGIATVYVDTPPPWVFQLFANTIDAEMHEMLDEIERTN